VYWFLEDVLPRLPDNVLYVIAGDGPERERLQKLLERKPQLKVKTLLLGQVSEHDKEVLLQTADIFVQPNIPVDNDVEGFGIAVIEATLRGRPAVVADLEGLKDAVTDKENGLLVFPEDVPRWQTALLSLIDSPQERAALGARAAHFTRTHFHWSIVGTMYTDYLSTLVYGRH
jgi:glycosyltransferase involved in cell wall biosynthesis